MSTAPSIRNYGWDSSPTNTGPPYVTVRPAADTDPLIASALSAAIGTSAPTHWIGPDTVALALGYFWPLRSDEIYLDPDLVVVSSTGDRWTVEVRVRVPINYPIMATAVNVDLELNHFFGVLSPPSPHNTYAPSNRAAPRRSTAATTPTSTASTTTSSGLFAEMAAEVKELSGLTDGQLGRIFPVTREQFQRWRTGREDHPSEPHIRRMSALRDLLRDARTRVDSLREWLLIPIGGASPYDLLSQARFEEVWELLTALYSRTRSQIQLDPDGGWRQVTSTAVRSGYEVDTSPPIPIPDDA